MIENLSEESSKEFLMQKQTGHLGCVLEDGEPYVIPVNYIVEGDRIFIHSMPGRKITAMEANPKVCLQVEEMADDGFEWKSVIAFGDFERIDKKETKTKVINQFFNKFPHFTPVEGRFKEEDFDSDVVVFCINIKRLTGVAENY